MPTAISSVSPRADRAIGLEFAGVAEIAESRAQSAPRAQRDEAERLQAQLAPGTALILLDERGKNLSSDDFADRIGRMRDGGRGAGSSRSADRTGMTQALRDKADLVLSFGALTWPHQMVRIMLGEQLYRAATILSGHPYHRA